MSCQGTSKAARSEAVVHLPAFSDLEIHNVECVVHRDPPDEETDLLGLDLAGTLGEGDLWVVASISVKVDGQVSMATDGNGQLPEAFERIEILKALQVRFSLVDLQGREMTPKGGWYDTSIGRVRVNSVTGFPWISTLEVDRDGDDVLKIQKDGRTGDWLVHGAAEILCCKDGDRDPDFRVKADVEVDRSVITQLLCDPCLDEDDEVCQIATVEVQKRMLRAVEIHAESRNALALNRRAYLTSRRLGLLCRDWSTSLVDAVRGQDVARRGHAQLVNELLVQSVSRSSLTTVNYADYFKKHGDAFYMAFVARTLKFIKYEAITVTDIRGDGCADATGFKEDARFTVALIEAVEKEVQAVLEGVLRRYQAQALPPSKSP